MSVTKEIVFVLFRIINVVLIAWLVKYVFQKYILPELKIKIEEKLAYFRGLEDKYKNLVDQNSVVEKEIKDQDSLFEMLKNKIGLWKKAREEQKVIKEKELVEINSYLKQKTETQEQNIQQKKLIKEVFPRVIDGTYKQLEQKFAEKKESTKFLKDILGYMKKETGK